MSRGVEGAQEGCYKGDKAIEEGRKVRGNEEETDLGGKEVRKGNVFLSKMTF